MNYLLFVIFFPTLSCGMKIGPEGRARRLKTLDTLLNFNIKQPTGHPDLTQFIDNYKPWSRYSYISPTVDSNYSKQPSQSPIPSINHDQEKNH